MIYTLTPVKLRPVLSVAGNVAEILQSPVPKKMVVVPHNGGFFSNFNKVMNHLVCSLNRRGVKAVEVDWTIERGSKLKNFFYGTHKDGNIWEYFFEQLLFPPRSFMMRKRTAYYRDWSITYSNVYALYRSGGEWRQQYHSAFKKFIRIKPRILQEVEQTYSRYMAGKYCIGVHVRNDAISSEQPDGHMPPLDNFIDETRRIVLSKKEDVKIFLATDVQEHVERFKKVFGEKVVTQKGVTRLRFPSDTEEGISFMYHSNLKLGEDVLKDCLLLAKCDVLIHRVSNIATAVGYINPSISMIYCQ